MGRRGSAEHLQYRAGTFLQIVTLSQQRRHLTRWNLITMGQFGCASADRSEAITGASLHLNVLRLVCSYSWYRKG